MPFKYDADGYAYGYNADRPSAAFETLTVTMPEVGLLLSVFFLLGTCMGNEVLVAHGDVRRCSFFSG